MQRFSKKRQAILDCLRATDTHPTAEWIYSQIKPAYPDLSLATVYRNLADLKSAGLIRSIGVVAGEEHFDADLSPHTHLLCARCGKITDLSDLFLPNDLIAALQSDTGCRVTEVQFSGVCRECIRKETEK